MYGLTGHHVLKHVGLDGPYELGNATVPLRRVRVKTATVEQKSQEFVELLLVEVRFCFPYRVN